MLKRCSLIQTWWLIDYWLKIFIEWAQTAASYKHWSQVLDLHKAPPHHCAMIAMKLLSLFYFLGTSFHLMFEKTSHHFRAVSAKFSWMKMTQILNILSFCINLKHWLKCLMSSFRKAQQKLSDKIMQALFGIGGAWICESWSIFIALRCVKET